MFDKLLPLVDTLVKEKWFANVLDLRDGTLEVERFGQDDFEDLDRTERGETRYNG